MMLFDKILKHRDAIAISMVFCSGPLNYGIRDGLGVAPNSAIFTLIFMFGGIFLALPYRDLNKLYRNDTPLTFLALVYLVVTLLYMFVYVKEYYFPITVKIYDCIVIGITLYFLFYLSTVKAKTLRFNFLRFSIFISFIGCLGLLAYAVLNPDFVLGQRLAISFKGDSEMDSMGNPHIFGRGAFFGIISALIYLKYETRSIYRNLTYLSLLVFLAVLVLSQAMSSIMAGFGAIAFFVWHNSSFLGLIKGARKLLTKWYFWVILIALIGKGIDVFRKNEAIIELGYNVIERRVEKLVNTIFASEDENDITAEEVVTDESAEGRVATLKIVRESLIENFEEGWYHKIFFGHGYFALYVDVPIVEVFHSYGLAGLSIFLVFFISMIIYSWREMKNPQTIISEWTAYGFVYFFIFTFTNGLIMDYNRWTFFIMVCRFMPPAIKYVTQLKVSKA
ncbi:hypothetical protein [Jiulongibacter sediminis]|uniref:O-antigen polymerase n=1 Tax=Jiulongibacter sediminis TaxID=1605367 RepID=A0A0P7BZG9_9BACT|nr:hypothetical protein [Jiulongibacter sediminis]KPM49853.1 hypothetical protein AFM12_04575 [Jiulongibacter sediminis]